MKSLAIFVAAAALALAAGGGMSAAVAGVGPCSGPGACNPEYSAGDPIRGVARYIAVSIDCGNGEQSRSKPVALNSSSAVCTPCDQSGWKYCLSPVAGKTRGQVAACSDMTGLLTACGS